MQRGENYRYKNLYIGFQGKVSWLRRDTQRVIEKDSLSKNTTNGSIDTGKEHYW
jgi:hypothetical protein